MMIGTWIFPRGLLSHLAAPLWPPQAPTHTTPVPLLVQLSQVLLLGQLTLPLRAVAAPTEL